MTISADRIVPEDYDFTAHLTHFCRALRSHGLLIAPSETADVMRALNAVDMMDKGRVYWALRALLLSRRDEIPIYDALFERFWNFEALPMRPHIASDDDLVGGAREFRRSPSIAMLPEEEASSENTLVQMLRTGASARRSQSRKDLSVIRADELSDISRIAAQMVRAMASRPGRRRRRHPRKGTPDLRGAFRLNMSSGGGDIVRIPRRRRIPRTPRLLVMLDVSGSMERHTQLLLQLVFAVSHHTKRVETFVFSTSAASVTREIGAASFGEALRRIALVAADWSGGTRIGDSLAHVNTQYEHILNRHTTVFLMSDGWDTGDPQRLALETQRMRRRAHRFVWLNPLLGSADYEPRTRSLQAAMPHIDCHASARDIESLRRLPGLLR